MERDQKFILWFEEITKEDTALVGSKNAHLGELYRKSDMSVLFPGETLNIPYGFAVTAAAYRRFIEYNNLGGVIEKILSDLNTENLPELESKGREIRQKILPSPFPADLEQSIKSAYDELSRRLKLDEADVAVRSSATVEDLPEASFAGQQDSYLHVRGHYELLESVKKAFASLFTNRAISYRVDRNFRHEDLALAVCVQKMVRADRGASGIMFSLDTENGFRDVVLINAAWGLGELVARGSITPDEYKIFKPALKGGFSAIIKKKLGTKEKKLIYSIEGAETTKQVPVSEADRHRFALSDFHIAQLARWAMIIEDYYGHPMDIEWAYDEQAGELSIVQARRETVQDRQATSVIEEYALEQPGKILVQGAAIGTKIGQGRARYISDPGRMAEFKAGEVLVTEATDPDWEPILKQAAAIVTSSGSRTSHTAILARELGIPAVVGCGEVGSIIEEGSPITVSCAEGEIGKVYEGLLKYKINSYDLSVLELPKTRVKMIVENPSQAFGYSFLPNQGVGLVRMPAIISNSIRIHPRALLDYSHLDPVMKNRIDDLSNGYPRKEQFFLDNIVYALSSLAAAFYPKEVFIEFSEAASPVLTGLLGGDLYEPRGTGGNFYNKYYAQVFAIECQAIKKVREEMGFKNIHVMVPGCASPQAGREIIGEMVKNGLKRERQGLQVWLDIRDFSIVLSISGFAEVFDGFSVDAEKLWDSKGESLKKFIAELARQSYVLGRKVDVYNLPSRDTQEFIKFLVAQGIHSVSVRPDMALKTLASLKAEEDRKK